MLSQWLYWCAALLRYRKKKMKKNKSDRWRWKLRYILSRLFSHFAFVSVRQNRQLIEYYFIISFLGRKSWGITIHIYFHLPGNLSIHILLVFCVLFSYSPSRRVRDPFNFMMMMILYCGTRCLSVLFVCYSSLCLSILQYANLLDTNTSTLPQGIWRSNINELCDVSHLANQPQPGKSYGITSALIQVLHNGGTFSFYVEVENSTMVEEKGAHGDNYREKVQRTTELRAGWRLIYSD